jgi:hypothetical protein
MGAFCVTTTICICKCIQADAMAGATSLISSLGAVTKVITQQCLSIQQIATTWTDVSSGDVTDADISSKSTIICYKFTFFTQLCLVQVFIPFRRAPDH